MSSAPVTEPTSKHEREDEFTSERHVYEPHRVGLPPIGSYVRELWRRREFAMEMARTNLRAQHFNTVFGQLWLVINPVLLACVYFVLVDILRPREGGMDFFAHLMAALFAYYFVSDAVRQAVKSVTSGGRLILNTAFPRALLPLSSVLTSFAASADWPGHDDELVSIHCPKCSELHSFGRAPSSDAGAPPQDLPIG